MLARELPAARATQLPSHSAQPCRATDAAPCCLRCPVHLCCRHVRVAPHRHRHHRPSGSGVVAAAQACPCRPLHAHAGGIQADACHGMPSGQGHRDTRPAQASRCSAPSCCFERPRRTRPQRQYDVYQPSKSPSPNLTAWARRVTNSSQPSLAARAPVHAAPASTTGTTMAVMLSLTRPYCIASLTSASAAPS